MFKSERFPRIAFREPLFGEKFLLKGENGGNTLCRRAALGEIDKDTADRDDRV